MVATRMVNEGVPLAVIQKYLGHKSPEMTMTYARIHDKTMRACIDKFHGKVVNVSGETIVVNPSLDNNQELQWMRRNVLAQALPNGSCARPKTQLKSNKPQYQIAKKEAISIINRKSLK